MKTYSIVAITNQSGQVVEKRLFDAWGLIIKVQDGVGNVLTGLVALDRGYTGHEHLQGVNLIHMNGRLYDPLVHRFLQPDNFVQDPYNTQNFNRYGYVLNNPLKYTDPSGELFWLIPVAIIVVSAAINVYYNWDDITNGTGKFSDISWGKFLGYTGSGAVSGALTVYGGPYGVIWAGGAQGLLNSMIRGDNLENTLSNTTTGLISGAVSYGINLKFDQLLPNGLIGGNNYLNSVLTGATREVISNFGGSFAGEFSRTWDFENSVRSAANPFNIGLSAVSGGLSGGLDFENSPKPKTQSPIIESLNLIPYYPMPIILPPVRTVIPPVYKPNNNFRYNFNN